MAGTQPTASLAKRRATVRHLADEGHSARAIARQLGIHHKTVARDLAATPAPLPAPPAPTSGASRAPHLLYDLAPDLIRDLNVLTDPRTGALPAPVRRYIRAAANARRADMSARLAQRASLDRRETHDVAP